jgi:hypothetical protein
MTAEIGNSRLVCVGVPKDDETLQALQVPCMVTTCVIPATTRKWGSSRDRNDECTGQVGREQHLHCITFQQAREYSQL